MGRVKKNVNYLKIGKLDIINNIDFVEGNDTVKNKNSKIAFIGTIPPDDGCINNEYYRNKNNKFWKWLGQIIGVSKLDNYGYQRKLKILKDNNIALADVYKQVIRMNSKDDGIIAYSLNTDAIVSMIKKSTIKTLICTSGEAKTQLKIILGLEDERISKNYEYWSSKVNKYVWILEVTSPSSTAKNKNNWKKELKGVF